MKNERCKLIKRVIDFIFSLVIFFVFLPLFLLLVVMIKLDSKGSAIFKHRRVGKDGREFILYKFRTMFMETLKYTPKPKENDPRITKVGRFLRNTGLDELPQLYNVLKGDMSLVGPRPEMPFIVKDYTEKERQRLKIKPGITGLWQISGKTRMPICNNLEYDLEYIKNQSLGLDLKILLKTAQIFIKSIFPLK